MLSNNTDILRNISSFLCLDDVTNLPVVHRSLKFLPPSITLQIDMKNMVPLYKGAKVKRTFLMQRMPTACSFETKYAYQYPSTTEQWLNFVRHHTCSLHIFDQLLHMSGQWHNLRTLKFDAHRNFQSNLGVLALPQYKVPLHRMQFVYLGYATATDLRCLSPFLKIERLHTLHTNVLDALQMIHVLRNNTRSHQVEVQIPLLNVNIASFYDPACIVSLSDKMNIIQRLMHCFERLMDAWSEITPCDILVQLDVSFYIWSVYNHHADVCVRFNDNLRLLIINTLASIFTHKRTQITCSIRDQGRVFMQKDDTLWIPSGMVQQQEWINTSRAFYNCLLQKKLAQI